MRRSLAAIVLLCATLAFPPRAEARWNLEVADSLGAAEVTPDALDFTPAGIAGIGYSRSVARLRLRSGPGWVEQGPLPGSGCPWGFEPSLAFSPVTGRAGLVFGWACNIDRGVLFDFETDTGWGAVNAWFGLVNNTARLAYSPDGVAAVVGNCCGRQECILYPPPGRQEFRLEDGGSTCATFLPGTVFVAYVTSAGLRTAENPNYDPLTEITTWSQTTVDADIVLGPSVATLPDGEPAIVYASAGGGGVLNVATRHLGAWSIEPVAAGSFQSAAITVDARGLPCVAFVPTGAHAVTFAYRTGGSWSYDDVSADLGSGVAGPSLALGPLGQPALAFAQAGRLRYALRGAPVGDPDTYVVTGPAEGTFQTATGAAFTWTGDDDLTGAGALLFSRRVDGGGWSPFSPDTEITLSGLGEGAHSLEIQAKDGDGNLDPTPELRHFVVDGNAPFTTLLLAPADSATVDSVHATFVWAGSDNLAPPSSLEFATRLDDEPWQLFGPATTRVVHCTSGGWHTLLVKARDPAGNEEGVPVSRTFRFASPPCDDLALGLVAWYPLDGNALDATGNGRDGTLVGNVVPAADRYGRGAHAMAFDGNGDYVRASATGLPTTERTMAYWLLLNHITPHPSPGIMGYGGSGCGNSWWTVMSGVDGNLQETFCVSAHCGAHSSCATPPANGASWHHYAVTTSPAGTALYFDGALSASTGDFVNNTYVTGRDFAMGAIVDGDGRAPFTNVDITWLDGLLDDVRIYDRALSAAEVAQLFAEPDLDVASPRPASVLTLAVSPNPARDRIRLAFTLPRAASTSLQLLDVAGRVVRVLRPGVLGAGPHEVAWSLAGNGGQNLPDGVYFARLEAGGVRLTRRLVVID